MTGAAMRRGLLTAVIILVSAVMLGADTLYLRNGERVQGQLVSVRNGTIEFREARLFNSRVLRIDQADVRRIEFDEVVDDTPPPPRREEPRESGRPIGMREKLVVVQANQHWTDTGIEVRPGQTIYFEAGGKIMWGRGKKDGPDGEENSPYRATRPMPNRPAAALIGKVGAESTDFFLVGSARAPFRMRGGGRLFLGINDDNVADNAGNFPVTVYY
jgi:hypothetical protein